MTLFNDLYSKSSFSILSESKTKDGDIMNVLVPFTQTDVENSNGRIYPRALMQREVDRVSKDIADGKMLGSADHPKSGNTELDKVSHLVKKMWIEKDGRGWASLSILNTNSGKNLKVILKSGAKLGVSTRGYGTFDDKTKIVSDDYRLTGLDVVANPSYKDGVFSQSDIFESLDLNLSKTKDLDKFSSGAYSKEGYMRKTKNENKDSEFVMITKTLWETDEDFHGSLKDYIDKNGQSIQAAIAVENGEYPDIKTALEEMGADDQTIADAIKAESIPAEPVEPKDVYETAKIARVPAKELAEKINEDNAKPAVSENRQVLWRQVWVSFGPSATKEKVLEAVERIEKASIRTEKPALVELSESEKILEAKKKRKQKRIQICQGMYTDGFLAGFSREQIDIAIAKRMAQLDEEEGL